ncbi:MAG: SDR family NAD(P)-dependent oxidoreductase [Deltaproteobacteria bacterium]|nr:SDR family NAD(P)-dependent oxidoreductase [Deltaproteobacteria bacterium]
MPLPKRPRVVITGAASGFGRALALALAARSARLVLSDVDVAGCQATAALALEAGAGSAVALRCDVTRPEDLEALAEAAGDGVDLLINNAGVATAGRVGELSLEDWRWTLDVDLWGAVHGCHVFVPILRRQGHGHILNVASAAGLLNPPMMGAYNVAKAGVVALSETLAGELAGTGVGVTVLCPTFFRTNIAASGRYADDAARRSATRLVEGGWTAETVARLALDAVDAGLLHAVPMPDGRWAWRLKRALPGASPRLLARAVAVMMRASGPKAP